MFGHLTKTSLYNHQINYIFSGSLLQNTLFHQYFVWRWKVPGWLLLWGSPHWIICFCHTPSLASFSSFWYTNHLHVQDPSLWSSLFPPACKLWLQPCLSYFTVSAACSTCAVSLSHWKYLPSLYLREYNKYIYIMKLLCFFATQYSLMNFSLALSFHTQAYMHICGCKHTHTHIL